MSNNALEQAASTARPWQKAHRKQSSPGGPRPVPRPPLLTAGVGHMLACQHGSHAEAI